MLPMACDRDRANGCAKSHRGIANGANDDGWAKTNDVVNESENESESVASASADDAKDARGMRKDTNAQGGEPTSLLRRSRSSGSQ